MFRHRRWSVIACVQVQTCRTPHVPRAEDVRLREALWKQLALSLSQNLAFIHHQTGLLTNPLKDLMLTTSLIGRSGGVAVKPATTR